MAWVPVRLTIKGSEWDAVLSRSGLRYGVRHEAKIQKGDTFSVEGRGDFIATNVKPENKHGDTLIITAKRAEPRKAKSNGKDKDTE